MIVQISGIGINMSMSVIGGRIWEDQSALGVLVRTLFKIRTRLFLIAIVPLILYSTWLFLTNNGSWFDCVFNIVIVVGIVWFQIRANLLGDVSKLLSKTSVLGNYELIPAIFRIVFVSCFFLAGGENYYLLIVITFLSVVLQYLYIKKATAHYYKPAEKIDTHYEKEVYSLMKPDILNTIYYVFQGQITIILVSVFSNVENLANISALSRIALLVTMVNTIIGGVVMPYFAKSNDLQYLKKWFSLLIAVYLLGMILFIGIINIKPQYFLWLIGEQYANLRYELLVMMLGTCFSQFVGIMWLFISTKGWVKYHWLYTPFTLVNQVVLLLTLDLSKPINIIWFGTLSSIGFFCINLISLYYGFVKNSANPRVKYASN
jgi:O-antigen/teichoic acid export membrane protein